jgi:hypothetical protein
MSSTGEDNRSKERSMVAVRPIRLAGFVLLRASLAVPMLLVAVSSARAELPDAVTLLGDLGLSAAEITKVQAGELVRHDVKPASERELTAGLAFGSKSAPNDLVGKSSQDLLDRVDPSVSAFGAVGSGGIADFAKLKLGADQAASYTGATPGGSLNLSTAEIAAFTALGASAPVAAVEQQVRQALLDRVQAYRTKGLAGIAPYARSDGQRSAGDELRIATEASKPLAQYAPSAYQALLSYPGGKPAGARESFHWTQFDAHGTPTISLTHMLLIPDGDAWIAVQRQFYVSTGYNSEQAVAAFLPAQSGTIVVYGNRTSTDQITGFGGGTKRSLGSRLLGEQLESMFTRARAAATK